MSSNNNKKSEREMAWDWIRKQSQFTARDLYQAVSIPRYKSDDFISHLLKKKRIERVSKRRGNIGAKYKVIDTGPLTFGSIGSHKGRNCAKGRQNSGKRKAWNTMRVLGVFSIGDISAGAEISKRTAGNYIRNLVKAGHVRCIHGVDRSNDPNSVAQFRLIRNSGPLHPVVRDNGVYDPNIDKHFDYQRVVSAIKIGTQQKETRHAAQQPLA